MSVNPARDKERFTQRVLDALLGSDPALQAKLGPVLAKSDAPAILKLATLLNESPAARATVARAIDRANASRSATDENPETVEAPSIRRGVINKCLDFLTHHALGQTVTKLAVIATTTLVVFYVAAGPINYYRYGHGYNRFLVSPAAYLVGVFFLLFTSGLQLYGALVAVHGTVRAVRDAIEHPKHALSKLAAAFIFVLIAVFFVARAATLITEL